MNAVTIKKLIDAMKGAAKPHSSDTRLAKTPERIATRPFKNVDQEKVSDRSASLNPDQEGNNVNSQQAKMNCT